MLHWTSCLFGGVVVYAYNVQNVWYHTTFLAVTIMSLLRWSEHNNRIVGLIDKATAHWAFVLVLLDTQRVIEFNEIWLLGFPLCVGVLWVAELSFLEYAVPLHCGLHVLSALGAGMYLWVLK